LEIKCEEAPDGKPVQFRQKIEEAIVPLLTELRGELAQLRTIDVLNHYQFRINFSQLNKDKLPDGFWAKGRYVSALALTDRFLEAPRTEEEPALTRIDELVEKIYDLYSFGAVYEPGKSPGSETEFLTRLGLGLRVREPDTLGFPEQFRAWAMARLPSFNERYFVPSFGLTFEEISSWLQNLSNFMENRLNGLVDGLRLILEDVNVIREQFASGTLGLDEARERSAQLKVPERLDANARDGDEAHILSLEKIKEGIPEASAKSLLALFGIRPGEVAPDFGFPHSANPLDRKLFVTFPDGTLYFLDPASAERVMARVFENAMLDDEKLRTRYSRSRDRAVEKLVLEDAKKVFSGAAIYPNYYLQRGSHEKDLMVVHGKTLILMECKNSRVRSFRGAGDDLLKFESDFANSVQLGYDQASEVKRRILANEETTFYDENGKVYFVVSRAQVERIFIVCITPRYQPILRTEEGER
jgi:hypothetical protein